MSTERLSPNKEQSISDLWVAISDEQTNQARKREMKEMRTTLSPTAISKLFPESRGEDSHYPHTTPFITTPKMLEEFVDQWDPDWRNKSSSFSLVPAFQGLFRTLRDIEGDEYIIYAQLRGLYRIFMLQNLLQTGWRPQREADVSIQAEQMSKDREFKARLRRLAGERNSSTWGFFAEEGYEIWKIGQAEVLAYMETQDQDWRKVFRKTHQDLRPR